MIYDTDVSKNSGKTSQIIHFRIFLYIPSILGVFPLFLETTTWRIIPSVISDPVWNGLVPLKQGMKVRPFISGIFLRIGDSRSPSLRSPLTISGMILQVAVPFVFSRDDHDPPPPNDKIGSNFHISRSMPFPSISHAQRGNFGPTLGPLRLQHFWPLRAAGTPVMWGVYTWRIIPVSKWLVTMVIVSPLNGVIPLINGLNGL